MPQLLENKNLGILEKPVEVLAKSRAYPYGLTNDKITRLKGVGITTVQDLVEAADDLLLGIEYVGPAMLKRMRDVTMQAIWM